MADLICACCERLVNVADPPTCDEYVCVPCKRLEAAEDHKHMSKHMSKHWPKSEEEAFRRNAHRWTHNEKLMVQEIDELRLMICKLLPDVKAFRERCLATEVMDKNIREARELIETD